MKISDLDHLRANQQIKYKQETIDGETYTIVSYMISSQDLWKIPGAIEARGVTFNSLGHCEAYPFSKFFNVGECESTQTHLVKELFDPDNVFEKRDGSMIMPVLTQDKIRFKTKKSFFSDVALEAQSTAPKNIIQFCEQLCMEGITPIFEYTSPNWSIVLDYGDKPKFVLLAARFNQSGKYVDFDRLAEVAIQFGVEVIPKVRITWDEMMNSVENDTGIEGYVLVLKNGMRVKLKTKWYLSMHHTMTDLRERDVAEAVVTEAIDDMKSLVSSQGNDITPLLLIEKRVVDEIAGIKKEVEIYANYWQDYSFKEAAIGLKGNEYFSLIMSYLRGKEPDYIDFWKRNYLKTYSLRCVYNLNFGVQEE